MPDDALSAWYKHPVGALLLATKTSSFTCRTKIDLMRGELKGESYRSPERAKRFLTVTFLSLCGWLDETCHSLHTRERKYVKEKVFCLTSVTKHRGKDCLRNYFVFLLTCLRSHCPSDFTLITLSVVPFWLKNRRVPLKSSCDASLRTEEPCQLFWNVLRKTDGMKKKCSQVRKACV